MKLVKIEESKLTFDDGSTVEDYHEQDCCENVYADFQQLADTDIFDWDLGGIHIECVVGSGFRINGYFVPCYDEQNGNYAGNLILIIKEPGKEERKVDIAACTEYREVLD